MREGKSFSKDFKLEAVRLLNEADKAAAQIAMELGSGEINYINGATNWKQLGNNRRCCQPEDIFWAKST